MLLRDRTYSLASPFISTRIRYDRGTVVLPRFGFFICTVNPVSKVSGWRHAIVQFSDFFFWSTAQFALIILFFEKIKKAYMNLGAKNKYKQLL
jgi:hypothetical protein